MIDPWEEKYIIDHPNKDLIAWCDVEAFERYPENSWVYDKALINNLFNDQEAIDLECEFPKDYPVMVKPKINLIGMGEMAYKANKKSEIKHTDGYVAQPFYSGEHRSTDFVTFNGEIYDSYTFMARKDNNGSFKYFKTDFLPYTLKNKLKRVIESIEFKSGIINVETIGNNIIEIHLRPSLQFYDICDDLIRRYLDSNGNQALFRHKRLAYDNYVSKVWRITTDMKLKVPRQGPLPLGVKSVQYTFYPQYNLSDCENDIYSYRVLVVNGSNFNAVKNYGNIIFKRLIANGREV